MKSFSQASLAFLIFAGLTMAMSSSTPASMHSTAALSAASASSGVIPSTKILHSVNIAVDLPLPTPIKSGSKNVAVDLPLPTPIKSGSKQNIYVAVDLPLPTPIKSGGKS